LIISIINYFYTSVWKYRARILNLDVVHCHSGNPSAGGGAGAGGGDGGGPITTCIAKIYNIQVRRMI